jgi:hypothetical protein
LFITSDQGLKYPQNLEGRKISILIHSTNKLRPILAGADEIQKAIMELQRGEVRRLPIPFEPKYS